MASLDMDCPWPCMGVGHTPGRGWVSLGCWCSARMLARLGSRGCCDRTSPDASASQVWPEHFSLLPAPRHTQPGQNRCKQKKSPGKHQWKTKITEGNVGGGREGRRIPEGPVDVCSQHWEGHGAGMCPCSLPKHIQELTPG